MTQATIDLVGTWTTQGTQHGWSFPASGAWGGKLVLRPKGASSMSFSKGNVAPKRTGKWSLTGSQLTITDTKGTRWLATVSADGRQMSGSYQAGMNNAFGGTWGAHRV